MSPEAKTKPEKKHYSQIGLTPETYEQFSKKKSAREKEMGIHLSWNDYIMLVIRDMNDDGKKK
jgi:hypothetical protein